MAIIDLSFKKEKKKEKGILAEIMETVLLAHDQVENLPATCSSNFE